MKKKSVKKHRLKPLQDKLWELCRQIIFDKYGNTCFTCGKTGLETYNKHCGHFIPRNAGAYLKYDLRNLRPQCYNCNINLGGNGAVYYRNMVMEEGQEYVDNLFRDKQRTIKADWVWYENQIEKYKEILKDISM